MEALFEFIFGNLAFLIFIIVGVMSFLKRTKQGETKVPRRKSFNPPNENGNPFDSPEPKVDVYSAKKDKRPTHVSIKHENESHHYHQKYKEIDQLHSETLTQHKIVIKHNETKNNMKLDLKKFNKKKVIDGIIWAEILGPPRAKKKHSYSSFRRG